MAAEPITDVDTTAADMLEDLDLELNASGVSLVFAEMKTPVQEKVQRYELTRTIDPDHFFDTIERGRRRVRGSARAPAPGAPDDRAVTAATAMIGRSRRAGLAAVGALVLAAAAVAIGRRRPGGRSGSAHRDAGAAPAGDRHGVGRGHPQGDDPASRPPSPRSCCWGSWPPSCSPPRATASVLVVVLALLAGSTVLVRYALRRDRQGAASRRPSRAPRWARPRTGVLIMNLRSGGGKAERFGLVEECRRRGIEPVVLAARRRPARARPGRDRRRRRRDRHGRRRRVAGAGRLGGDGAPTCPLVCVPAGTRNHFALDLGLDRDDVVGALDAFDAAVERRIDLAEVNGRVFVNNVSLGVYAKIVQSPEYRDAKRQTTTAMLPELLGPGAEPFDLHFVGPDGTRRDGAQIIQVSNNPYVLTSLAGFGSRARLDTGELGVAAADIRGAGDVAALRRRRVVGPPRPVPRLDPVGAPTLHRRVERARSRPGVDGEALLLDPPLEFRSLPGALRVRIPTSAPGYSPAALNAPSPWWTLTALVRAAAGRTTPIDETQR